MSQHIRPHTIAEKGSLWELNALHVFRTIGWRDKKLNPEEDDYVGCWEDAFLYKGFEKGKYNFLTSAIAQTVQRHGFRCVCDYPPNLSFWVKKNDIIKELWFSGKNVIPDTTVDGNKVAIGYTHPRKYLPPIVQKIFDDEFGYDKDFEGKQRIFNINL